MTSSNLNATTNLNNNSSQKAFQQKSALPNQSSSHKQQD